MSSSSQLRRSHLVVPISVLLSSSTLLLSAFVLHKSVSTSFGDWPSFLRYVWTGDALTPPDRSAVTSLASVESRLSALSSDLDSLAVAMSRDVLNSVDGGPNALSGVSSPYHHLTTASLARVSAKLDEAVKILDAIPASKLSAAVKRRKRAAAEEGVRLFGICDRYVREVERAKEIEAKTKEKARAIHMVKMAKESGGEDGQRDL